MVQIGSLVNAYDNYTKRYEQAELVNIRYNIPCCVGTESEHVHDIVYDVKFLKDGRLSRGLLSINDNRMKGWFRANNRMVKLC